MFTLAILYVFKLLNGFSGVVLTHWVKIRCRKAKIISFIFKSNLCKKDKNVIYLGLLAQIEGAWLNNVFDYFLYFLSYG